MPVKDLAKVVTLRAATADDRSFLLEVYASARSDELAGLGWDDNLMQAFIGMQFDARTRCYPKADDQIILLHERPIGRMLVDRTEEAILLVDIALLTEYRNAGIGAALLKDLQQEATAFGKPIRLHVLATSEAVRLYERLGFSRTGRNAAYLEMVWLPLERESL